MHFPYGIFSHLEWVSNTGYKYLNFHYNPAHMIAVSFFFATTFASIAAWVSYSVRDKPRQGADGKNPGARRYILSRHHGLFDRHTGDPQPRALPGPLGRLLERGLHRHQRTGLVTGLAGVVELVAQPPDLGLTRKADMAGYQNIFTQVQVRGPVDFGVPLPAGAMSRDGPPVTPDFWASSGTRRSVRSIWAFSGSRRCSAGSWRSRSSD